MQINAELIARVCGKDINEDIRCNCLGLVDSSVPNTLTFLDSSAFADELKDNPNISAAFVTEELSREVSVPIKKIIVDEPRFYFFTLLNYVGRASYKKSATIVEETAQVHATAYIAEHNAVIGRNTVIEPNVTILNDVTIGENCIIRAGAVIGSEGFEHKRTSKGILSVRHDGVVQIGNDVEIGSNSCVDKGFSFRQTIIGDENKIDNLVHVGHGVQTGKRCLFAACSMLGGSVTYGDDVWVGPNATVVSGITVASKAVITLGAVVTKDVAEGERVSGNFAIPHQKFLVNLKKALQ